jgi:hypothetical protein
MTKRDLLTMKSFEIDDIKKFMNELLNDAKFDSFYMYEARLKTSLDYFISGKINHEFYDGGDTETEGDTVDKTQEYVYWKDVKHTLFELIKGKRLPVNFKFILMFNRDNITRLIEMNNLALAPENVGALFYNIYYDDGKLQVTTGSSIRVFSLDKSLDNLWDNTVEKYYLL